MWGFAAACSGGGGGGMRWGFNVARWGMSATKERLGKCRCAVVVGWCVCVWGGHAAPVCGVGGTRPCERGTMVWVGRGRVGRQRCGELLCVCVCSVWRGGGGGLGAM